MAENKAGVKPQTPENSSVKLDKSSSKDEKSSVKSKDVSSKGENSSVENKNSTSKPSVEGKDSSSKSSVKSKNAKSDKSSSKDEKATQKSENSGSKKQKSSAKAENSSSKESKAKIKPENSDKAISSTAKVLKNSANSANSSGENSAAKGEKAANLGKNSSENSAKNSSKGENLANANSAKNSANSAKNSSKKGENSAKNAEKSGEKSAQTPPPNPLPQGAGAFGSATNSAENSANLGKNSAQNLGKNEKSANLAQNSRKDGENSANLGKNSSHANSKSETNSAKNSSEKSENSARNLSKSENSANSKSENSSKSEKRENAVNSGRGERRERESRGSNKVPFRTEFKPKETFEEFNARFEDDENFADLMSEYDDKDEKISLVSGKIVDIVGDEVYVDIGEKAEGILPLSELKADSKGKKSGRGGRNSGENSAENLAENDENAAANSSKNAANLSKNSHANSAQTHSASAGAFNEAKNSAQNAAQNSHANSAANSQTAELKGRDDMKNLLFKIGDFIKVAITGRRGGKAILSYKKALRKEKVSDFIANMTDADFERTFEVKIVAKNKSGYVCTDDSGVEFFLPKSEYTFKEISAIGKKLAVKIIKVKKDELSIVISRRRVLGEERKKQRELVSSIAENPDIIEGVVKTITNYGIFVDVGGMDGLVHYSELSHRTHVSPHSLYAVGDKVPVKIINYDKKKKQLSLSVKAAQPDPWDEISDSLEVGDTIKVLVSNVESYGAFVDIGNDIEGFLHISEMTWDKSIKDPNTIVQKGQELDVEVIDINPETKRLRVSLKNLQLKPFDEFIGRHAVGEVVKGEVTSTTNFGAFVKIDGVEGLLHNEDCSWERKDQCKDLYKVGDKIEVKIIRIDKERQKLSLSVKELTPSPASNYIKAHKIGQIVSGKIKDIKEFGLFVELDTNVDALIHKDDIGLREFEEAKVGDEIEAALLSFDDKRGRVRLSVKNLHRIKEREALQEFNKNADEKMTLGDLIKEKLN